MIPTMLIKKVVAKVDNKEVDHKEDKEVDNKVDKIVTRLVELLRVNSHQKISVVEEVDMVKTFQIQRVLSKKEKIMENL